MVSEEIGLEFEQNLNDIYRKRAGRTLQGHELLTTTGRNNEITLIMFVAGNGAIECTSFLWTQRNVVA